MFVTLLVILDVSKTTEKAVKVENKPPPPSSSPPPTLPVNQYASANTSQNKNVVIRAAEILQQDITGTDDYVYRDSSIIMNALRYIQYDVCRAPITVK